MSAGLYPSHPGAKERRGASEAAAVGVAGRADILRRAILVELARGDGTTDEVAEALSASVLSIRPRFTELQHDGLIEKTDGRRRNASGAMATVWRLSCGSLDLTACSIAVGGLASLIGQVAVWAWVLS